MSDSDSDELQNSNVFTFQNKNLTMSGCGPGGNFSNIGASFRGNLMSSTRMPPIYERSKYSESSYDHYNMHTREMSPMSVKSVCDARQRQFNFSLNPHGMSSARSMYNGRAGSPMSMRSIDSSASVRAVDVANDIKHNKYSKSELKLIGAALRNKVRKRNDKRRYRKVRRRLSGEDSGEQGSDSSVSSDDRSTKTAPYKGHMSSSRSVITDISAYRHTIKNNEMFRANLKNDMSFRTTGPVNLNTTQMSLSSSKRMPTFKKPPIFPNKQSSQASVMLQKERFTNGFLLPSQRFNKTVSSTTIPENVVNEVNDTNGIPPVMNRNFGRNIDTDSDGENIFSHGFKRSDKTQRKRCIDHDDDDEFFLPQQKRLKPLSPCKNSKEAQKLKPQTTSNDDNAEDFIFAKPTFPVKKLLKEKIISKSAAPLLDSHAEVQINHLENTKLTKVLPIQKDKDLEQEDEPSNTTQNSTNISMRPSFIKRKLFTQKLDVSEKRNVNNDSLNSPQNSMCSATQKERKTRKLQQATTQSCLNRDLQNDENNLFNLIKKIVPIDQMNVTKQTNITEIQSKNITENNIEKWDESDITCSPKKSSNVSDTYTDEENFNSTNEELQRQEVGRNNTTVFEKGKSDKGNGLLKDKFLNNKTRNKEKVVIQKELRKDNVSEEAVVLNKGKVVKDNHRQAVIKETVANKLSPKKDNQQQAVAKQAIAKKPSPKKDYNCKIILKRLPAHTNFEAIKQFWDTDFESDMECTSPMKNKNSSSKENHSSMITDKRQKEVQKKDSVSNLKKLDTNSNTTLQNFTFGNMKKFNASSLRIRSHRDPWRPKYDGTSNQNTSLTIHEPEINKPKLCSNSVADKNYKSIKETTTKNDQTQALKEKTSDRIALEKNTKESAKDTQNDKKSSMKHNGKITRNETTTRKMETNNKAKQSTEKSKDKKSNVKNAGKCEKKNVVESKSSKTKSLKSDKIVRSNDSTLTEENNNNSYRPVRSCRLKNSSLTDTSNATLNSTVSMTLRSRKIDLSDSDVKVTRNIKKRNAHYHALKNLSESFSSYKDDSVVSFSLNRSSPSPNTRKTRSNSTVKKKNNLSKSVLLRNSIPLKDLFASNNRSIRHRVPTKRFLS